MITRIEIDGFKTFQDFAVDLAPFQVIIGANGCGKSNFFDALHLLSQIINSGVYVALQSLRGRLRELFTQLPDGKSADKIRFGVEMLVTSTVRDEWGQSVELANPRLRYELEIRYRPDLSGVEWLSIEHESLTSIMWRQDRWLSGYELFAAGIRSTIDEIKYIVTEFTGSEPAVRLLQDNTGIMPRVKTFSLRSLEKTMLSAAQDCETPHALAVRQEIQSWQFANIETYVMSMSPDLQFSGTPTEMITGNQIPYILAKMQAEVPEQMAWVSRDMASLIPNLRFIEVATEPDNRIVVYANMQDGRRFSIRVLSDGTLRLLALATLRNDPKRQGEHSVICFEDPEEDVHPGVLKRLVGLMRDMTANLFDDQQLRSPLRQLLVTTHSPEFVSHLDVRAGELLYAEMVTRMQPGQLPMQVTRMTPVGREIEGDKAAKSYTLNQVFKYLNNADYQAIRNDLQKAGG